MKATRSYILREGDDPNDDSALLGKEEFETALFYAAIEALWESFVMANEKQRRFITFKLENDLESPK